MRFYKLSTSKPLAPIKVAPLRSKISKWKIWCKFWDLEQILVFELSPGMLKPDFGAHWMHQPLKLGSKFPPY